MTMLSQETIQSVAQRLDAAEKTRVQIRQISLDNPEMSIEDAYAIQREWIKLKLGAGQQIVGHKIGLTSRAMQQSSQITEPDYGTLMDRMVFKEGGDIPFERFIAPRVEIELAFILAKRLEGPKVSIFDVLKATDYITPAIEIIDQRCPQVDPETKRMRKVFDTISDNAANAGIILGGKPVRPHDVDLRWVAGLCYKNGVIEETGVAAGVLNHPAHGIAWLARKFAPHGVALEPGQIILAGSFIRPVPAEPGDTFHTDYGPLGAIGFRFV